MPAALINGRPGDELSPTDRGLAYGDGVFETVAVAAGKARLWPRHLARLLNGCRRLGIVFDDVRLLEQEVQNVAAHSGEAVLKVIVTGGDGGRGYRRPEPQKPTRIVMALPPPDYPDDFRTRGVAVRFCRKRLAYDPDLAGIKHLNRLEQVMARMEWREEFQEGILSDYQDQIVEGTMSNLFVVKEGALQTPPLNDCGVRGVMREWIIEVCRERGIAVSETPLRREDLVRADGIFLCNAVIRAWPVRTLEGAVDYDVTAVRQMLKRLPFARMEHGG